MSQNTRTISLVRTSSSSLVPLDPESLTLMGKLNMGVNRLDSDFLPVLELACKRANIQVELLGFKSILNEFLRKIAGAWQAVKGRKNVFTKGQLIFTAPLDKSVKTKKSVDRLNDSLAKFFARWGFAYSPTYSEDTKGKKLKLAVEYSYCANKTPVIAMDEKHNASLAVDILHLGFTKVRFTLNKRRESPSLPTPGSSRVADKVGTPFHIMEVLVQAGSNWEVVHTSTFADHEIRDLSPIIETLTLLQSKNKTLGGLPKFTTRK